MKKGRYIFLLIALALLPALATVAKKAPGTADDASVRKARYYYLEGARLQSEDDAAGAYEMFKHALRANPDYPEAALQVAQMRVMLRLDTLRTRTEQLRSLDMMRKYIDKYPEDFSESQYYGYIATQLDTLAEARRVYARADSLFPERTMSLLRLAEVCVMMRDKEGALDALDRYQRREGRSDYLTQLKSYYLVWLGDTVAAREEADINVRENPKSASAQLLRAKVFELSDAPDSARTAYEAAERLEPDDGSVKFELARFLLERGDTAAYERKVCEGLLCDEPDAEEKIGMLTEFVKSVNLQSADTLRVDRLFSVMSDQYPHEPALRELSASYNFQRGNLPAAMEDIDYAIDLDPTNEQYYTQKLIIDAYAEKYADALRTFRRAEEVLEPSWRMLEMAGQCAALEPDTVEAYRIYDILLSRVAPGLHAADTTANLAVTRRFGAHAADVVSGIYRSLGDMLHNVGDNAGAFAKYRVALEIDPENALALNNCAYFMAVDGGDLEKALEMSGNSLEIDPKSSTFLDTFAYILLKLGRPAEALDYQLQAVEGIEEENEASSEMYDHLGDIYSAIGEKEKAVESWRKALELNPESNELKTKLGNVK